MISNQVCTYFWSLERTSQPEAAPVYYLPSLSASNPVSSCPVHPCSSIFWVLCLSDLNLTVTFLLQTSLPSILIPFSTLQPFPTHPRPSSSSPSPILWLSARDLSKVFCPSSFFSPFFPWTLQSLDFPVTCSINSSTPLYLSCSLHLISLISYSSHKLIFSNWLLFSDSAFFLQAQRPVPLPSIPLTLIRSLVTIQKSFLTSNRVLERHVHWQHRDHLHSVATPIQPCWTATCTSNGEMSCFTFIFLP